MNDEIEVSIDDVTELWNVGAVNLPQVADQYGWSAFEMHQSRATDDTAFNRTFSGEGMSTMFQEFDALRSLLQDKVLVKSRNGCVKAGDTLTKIADSFATADYLNAEEIDKYKNFKDGVKTGPEYEQPPHVIDAPSSDDPVTKSDG